MNLKAGQETLNLISTIRAMIGNSCIIDFGFVQSVPYEGLVNVSVAVAKTKQDMQIMTCVLANPASSSLTTYIKPHVLVRHHHHKIFQQLNLFCVFHP